MKFAFTKTFEKQLKKLIESKPSLKGKLQECFVDFQKYLLDSSFYRKQLALYDNVHELAVGGDVRVIVQIVPMQDTAYFINIGNHATLQQAKGKKTRLNPVTIMKPSGIDR